jgi:hypothetical protein
MSQGTTQWISEECAKILDELSNIHKVPKSKILNYLVYSFALTGKEARELLLDLGLTVQTHFDMGMTYEFDELLIMPKEFWDLFNEDENK